MKYSMFSFTSTFQYSIQCVPINPHTCCRYKSNPWLTNLDWSVKKYRGKRSKAKDMKLLLNDIHNLWEGSCIQPAHPTGSRRSAEVFKEEVTGDGCEFLILPVSQDGDTAVERRRQPVHMPGVPE